MSLMSDFPQAEDWAAEFAESTVFSFLPDGIKEGAPAVCAEFLRRAGPAEDADLRRLMLEVLPSLDLPPALRASLPETLQEFLGWLEDTGRLGGGRSLGLRVRALGPAYRERCSPKGGLRVPPAVNKTPGVGRNDPCPCGSGKKYKKCCAT
jgi:hypothetical protein